MADRNHKAEDGTSVRHLTVSKLRQPFYRPKHWPSWRHNYEDYPPVPWIRLSGRWLEEAGFEISGKARVEVQKGKLVITPA
ncbi:SymE family type I addiction module toxin [Paraburkholderia sp. SARCC-3016]|uniref:SymE family type I addiction module toxin n=1 Tax=Paraburkholderia sp. SARCC-3016 TaxID=3058611 RepID=UPI0028077166|nr:SymE family type I addiction module toxin [Paraburkholderia sp. SARCC-3016]MDQ7982492.1 SymE family type I addiction module toxin [Paraburkholderia sp. SARCC-3016]